MRSGLSATEHGNTYEQLVRTWRLAEFITTTLTTPPPAPAPAPTPPCWLTFQHAPLRPWDDIVELTPDGLVAWQVKNLVNPLAPAQLAEFLTALHTQPSIHRAFLAASHVLSRPAGLDLVVVDGLANTSRIASGNLPRFTPEQKEHTCLVEVARLMGGISLEDAFRTLGRFELRILHGKPDVHALTTRALHPFFEDPEGLARALLEFVVDTAAPGVQIHFDTLRESSIELLPVESARLNNVENGVIIPLGTVEGDRVGQFVLSLDHKVEPLGTFGDVFLSCARAGGDSGGAHGWYMAHFIALDLQTGQQFQLPTTAEAEAYVASLTDHAKRQILSERELGLDLDQETPTITVCAPYYDDAYTLRARLQFTFEVCYADTDEAWGDYTASTMLEVDSLPSTLAPLATAPAVLRTYWAQHPKDDRCGWTRVPSAGPARERLEALVRDHHAKPHH